MATSTQWTRFAALYIKVLAVLAVFLVAMGGTYIGMHAQRVFPADDQIVIYGRDSCGFTIALRDTLDAQKIPYVYANLDKPLISEELWAKVDLPPSKTTVTLPMVQINGSVLESPSSQDVLHARTAPRHRRIKAA